MDSERLAYTRSALIWSGHHSLDAARARASSLLNRGRGLPADGQVVLLELSPAVSLTVRVYEDAAGGASVSLRPETPDDLGRLGTWVSASIGQGVEAAKPGPVVPVAPSRTSRPLHTTSMKPRIGTSRWTLLVVLSPLVLAVAWPPFYAWSRKTGAIPVLASVIPAIVTTSIVAVLAASKHRSEAGDATTLGATEVSMNRSAAATLAAVPFGWFYLLRTGNKSAALACLGLSVAAVPLAFGATYLTYQLMYPHASRSSGVAQQAYQDGYAYGQQNAGGAGMTDKNFAQSLCSAGYSGSSTASADASYRSDFIDGCLAAIGS
mgnify:CR=1 FL=1